MKKKAANKNSRSKDNNQKVPDNSVNKVKVRGSENVVTNSKRKIKNEEKPKQRIFKIHYLISIIFYFYQSISLLMNHYYFLNL